jgi:hypothetical protein
MKIMRRLYLQVVTAVAGSGERERDVGVQCAVLKLENYHQANGRQETFVANYLKDAQRRFREQRQLRAAEDARVRAASAVAAQPPPPPYSSTAARKCRTPGCQFSALPDLSLCDRCASQQTWGTLNRSVTRSGGGGGGYMQSTRTSASGYNTFPGRHKAPTGLPSSSGTSDEIYLYGKSKFYTPHPEEPTSPTPASVSNASLEGVKDVDRQSGVSGGVSRPAPAPRPRSPSPDYDNLRYGNDANPKCATAGCEFYGNKSTGGLCSSCYRNKPYPAQLAKPEKTTRL